MTTKSLETQRDELLAALELAHTILLGIDSLGLYQNGIDGKEISNTIAKTKALTIAQFDKAIRIAPLYPAKGKADDELAKFVPAASGMLHAILIDLNNMGIGDDEDVDAGDAVTFLGALRIDIMKFLKVPS